MSYYIRGQEGELRIEDENGVVYSRNIKTRVSASNILEKRMIRDRLYKKKVVK